MELSDLFILIVLFAAFLRGKEIGSVRQIFSTVGFLLGLFVGSMVSPLFVNFGQTAISRSLLTFIIMLSSALLMLSFFEFLGELAKHKLTHRVLNTIDRGIGSLMSVVTVMAIIWLAAAVIIKLPYPRLQDEIRNSAIISSITNIMPPAPRLIADLGHLINPNAFPQVFSNKEPTPQNTPLPDLGSLQAAVTKAESSVVKIEGRGCGGVVEGSGFIAGERLIATNAHVIAGVKNPVVIDGAGRHNATPIIFDSDLDFAVLRVNDLRGGILSLVQGNVKSGTPGAALGYPKGGDFDAQPATISDQFRATGRDIYNQRATTRDIYEVNTHVVPGNSGGPLIDQHGNVIGVIFAQSTTYSAVGYALTSDSVMGALTQAKTQQEAVSTGTCAQ